MERLKRKAGLFFILFSFAVSILPVKAGPGTSGNTDLPLPAVPDSIVSGKEKIAYILQHFWDDLDFASDPRACDLNFMEQSICDFVSIMAYADEPSSKRAADTAIGKAAAKPETIAIFANLTDLYLYEPNSPYYSETLYSYFLPGFLESGTLDDAHRERYAYQRECMLKNRPGTIASDFSYITVSGEKGKLHDLVYPGKLLLLFFNPDCDKCRHLISSLEESPMINGLISDGRLTILAIYSEKNRDLRKEYLPKIPDSWITGFDDGIIDEQDIYVLRSLPSLYILDNDKKIIGKDINPERLSDYFFF